MIRFLIIPFLMGSMVYAADIFAMVNALDRNDTDAFKSMVRTIEDANTARSDNNKSILMYAVWVGNEEAVKELVSKGSDINHADESGATALHLAIWKDRNAIALYLIEKGASVNALSRDGMTPSDIALLRSNTQVMEAIEKKKPKLKPLL